MISASMMCIAVLVTSQSPAPAETFDEAAIASRLEQGWRFVLHRTDDDYEVRAVHARSLTDSDVASFLNTLPSIGTLSLENTALSYSRIRALARSCPALNDLHVVGGTSATKTELNAAVYPAFLAFPHLTSLSIAHLRFSGDERWPPMRPRELNSLRVSGNIAGMLSAVLAPFQVNSLAIELEGSGELTRPDYAALNAQKRLESLAIVNHLFGQSVTLDLSLLPEAVHVKRLELQNCTFDPSLLHRFPRLEVLSLNSCSFVSHAFGALLAHPSLREITLTLCRNDEVGVDSALTCPPNCVLRKLTLDFPVFAEIAAFQSLPVDVAIHLGTQDLCGQRMAPHGVKRFGVDEVAVLEGFSQLRGVSLWGRGEEMHATASALVRLAQVETLRELKLNEVRITYDRSADQGKASNTYLETVHFALYEPLDRWMVESLVGPSTKTVFLSSVSADRVTSHAGLSDVRADRCESVTLFEMGLPFSGPHPARQLLASPLRGLTLLSCSIEEGAFEPLIEQCPKLQDIALRDCLVDERELLRLARLRNLKSIDFSETVVSLSAALAIKAERVGIGRLPQPQRGWGAIWGQSLISD